MTEVLSPKVSIVPWLIEATQAVLGLIAVVCLLGVGFGGGLTTALVVAAGCAVACAGLAMLDTAKYGRSAYRGPLLCAGPALSLSAFGLYDLVVQHEPRALLQWLGISASLFSVVLVGGLVGRRLSKASAS